MAVNTTTSECIVEPQGAVAQDVAAKQPQPLLYRSAAGDTEAGQMVNGYWSARCITLVAAKVRARNPDC